MACNNRNECIKIEMEIDRRITDALNKKTGIIIVTKINALKIIGENVDTIFQD